MSTTQHTLIFLAVLLIAVALFLIGGAMFGRVWRLKQNLSTIDQKIAAQNRAASGLSVERESLPWRDRIVALSAEWVDTPFGRQLVAEEDRHLLDQCGVNDKKGQALFFAARVVLAILLPLIGYGLLENGSWWRLLLIVFFGLAIGYMLPKWVMQRVAQERRRKAAEELPLLIDLLRLLQGVGLSVDQSLHVIETEFSNVLNILGDEIAIAASQYRAGRTREQSMRRFSTVFDNADLQSVGRLIVQVEHHGGAVQEPLKLFSERIREQRKLDMKERVGKVTVKMTGVMVLTLLPGLLVITGGVGFLAVIRALTKMSGNL
ncbi:type II secretion system F family protein [Glaciimonas sp. Gout2]|uniref:type II secretion system F family protein n=1 Tax=unclassified Glaciimonas TaxID=2644401 RepID=UPI002B226167|nr:MULTISPECIES: type II secretion system F family protein [unclassified Glaciimonas]MEB0013064.1 type II secretion system F family protein [Glaciimonas sp. Cout2]MEB0083631.1 type II secretion system F family protein [Glaciimonas sp. Gout2]